MGLPMASELVFEEVLRRLAEKVVRGPSGGPSNLAQFDSQSVDLFFSRIKVTRCTNRRCGTHPLQKGKGCEITAANRYACRIESFDDIKRLPVFHYKGKNGYTIFRFRGAENPQAFHCSQAGQRISRERLLSSPQGLPVQRLHKLEGRSEAYRPGDIRRTRFEF